MIEYVLCIPQIDDFQFVLINSKQNKWNFPGGKIETNENPLDACIREFMEETGFLHLNWNNVGEFGNDNFKVHVFHALNYDFYECRTQPNESTVEIIDLYYSQNDKMIIDEYVNLLLDMCRKYKFVTYFKFTHRN